ncbi:hypothetical protein GCM10010495_37690 [Kitasatospora herbaricolor]|nr:hypothetical protein GCM10010495_37690 [Kitasatospora herbaricolor]
MYGAPTFALAEAVPAATSRAALNATVAPRSADFTFCLMLRSFLYVGDPRTAPGHLAPGLREQSRTRPDPQDVDDPVAAPARTARGSPVLPVTVQHRANGSPTHHQPARSPPARSATARSAPSAPSARAWPAPARNAGAPLARPRGLAG